MSWVRTFVSVRRAIPTVCRFAWNCLRRLRTVTCAVLVLSLLVPFANVEAGYCGRSFDFHAARIRWADTRQSGTSFDHPDEVCRAYGHQFYEAVEARQTASECEFGVHRQRYLEILDAEIEAFNNLIATQCRT